MRRILMMAYFVWFCARCWPSLVSYRQKPVDRYISTLCSYVAGLALAASAQSRQSVKIFLFVSSPVELNHRRFLPVIVRVPFSSPSRSCYDNVA